VPLTLLAGPANSGKVATLLDRYLAAIQDDPILIVPNRPDVDRIEREHGRVVITKHGRAAAVILSVEDLESLEETLDVMDSEALLADIRESLAELAGTDAPVLSKDEALRMITGR